MLGIPKTADKLRKLAADQTIVRFPENQGPVAKRGEDWEPGQGRHVFGRTSLRPRSPLKATFLLLVLLPTILVGLYFAFIAADQYSVTAQFAVRTKDTSVASVEGLSLLSGLTGSTANSSDSYIVTKYIYSRDLIAAVDKTLNVREVFSRPEADFWAQVDPDAAVEDLVDYWSWMVTADYDTYSGIIDLQVRTFRPEDAVALAEKILVNSEKLVNDMSRRAREDSVSEAESEVARAEMRLRLARKAMAEFRGRELRLDPVATAEARERIIGELEGRLASLQTQLSTLRAVSPDSPRIASAISQERAIQQQIIDVRARTNLSDSEKEGSLNAQLTSYEELETERMFAEKAFISALATLEAARVEANAQNRYVTVFVEPKLPDVSRYPERLRWTVVVFVLCFLVWGIGALIFAGVRDHIH